MKPVDVNDPDSEKYRGFRIKTIHAIVATDEKHDNEGIPAVRVPGGALPLIAADEVRLKEITEMAQEIADEQKRNFKIVRFAVREDIGEIKSRTTS
jgi:hypothetical protein